MHRKPSTQVFNYLWARCFFVLFPDSKQICGKTACGNDDTSYQAFTLFPLYHTSSEIVPCSEHEKSSRLGNENSRHDKITRRCSLPGTSRLYIKHCLSTMLPSSCCMSIYMVGTPRYVFCSCGRRDRPWFTSGERS